MMPFRAPRKCVKEPARAEQTDQIESEEATNLSHQNDCIDRGKTNC
jgi:hypothetical protein